MVGSGALGAWRKQPEAAVAHARSNIENNRTTGRHMKYAYVLFGLEDPVIKARANASTDVVPTAELTMKPVPLT